MYPYTPSTNHVSSTHQRRRGVVMVFALVMMVVLIGFASLTLDVGALYNARADLQNAADAAALAGASMLGEDLMAKVRMSGETNAPEVTQDIYDRAVGVAEKVISFGGKHVILESADVVCGWTDLTSATSAIDISQPASKMNAVHVNARRAKGSAGGPVELFFASIFGNSSADVSASATAAFDDRVAGFDPDLGGADLFPMTLSVTEYNKSLGKNSDKYEFDSGMGFVSSGNDDMPEVDIYPMTTTPGNYGLLNIGSKSQGAVNVADQILNGVSGDSLENEIGEPVLRFYDDDGKALTHKISGNPGLKASLEDDIKSRIGDVVAIPIHSTASGSGANTQYTIVGVRFVRVMDVKLKSGSKGFWVQPVTYTGAGVLIDPGAPSSGGVAGRMVLVR